MSQFVGSSRIPLAPALGRTRMRVQVIEHVAAYPVGRPVAAPEYQTTGARSARFLEPTRRELPVMLKSAARLDEAATAPVSDPSADPG